jgi:hypothetical protein
MGKSKATWRGAFAQRVQFSTTISDLFAVVLVALLAVPAAEQLDTKGFASAFASTANRQLAAVTGYLRNPLTVFGQRSPGARGSGHLLQTKQPRQFKLAKFGKKPHEQVLALVNYPSPLPPYLNDLAPIAGPGFLDISPPGIGFGGGPTGPTGSQPGIPSPVAPIIAPSGPGKITSPVPEPNTWLMAIWGMAMVGWGLRAKQRHLAKGGVRIGFRALN